MRVNSCTLPLSDRRAALERELNRRFTDGRPSNSLSTAGVVMRGYDAVPASHPASETSWITHGPLAGVASASLVNARTPYMFAGNSALIRAGELVNGHVGIIISSLAAQAALACSYPGDAASIYVRCESTSRSSDSCSAGCVGNRILPGFCLDSKGERRRDFCRGTSGPTPSTRQQWCSSVSKDSSRDASGDGSAGGLAEMTTSAASRYSTGQGQLGGCDGSGCHHHLDYGGSKASCAWRPSALEVAMELQENVTAARLAGCPASQHPWCSCVFARRTCCTYPACPLYNEVILSAQALERFKERNDVNGSQVGVVEAVYFLERSGAASDESFAQAARAATALHSVLHAASPGCKGAEEEMDTLLHRHRLAVNGSRAGIRAGSAAGSRANSRANSRAIFAAAPQSASPILVAVDLSRAHPFRLVSRTSAPPAPSVSWQSDESRTTGTTRTDSGSSSLNRTLLAYLSLVYPTSIANPSATTSTDMGRQREAELLQWHARNVQWLYHDSGLPAATKGAVVARRSHMCRDCYFRTLRRLESASRFPELAASCNVETARQTSFRAACFRSVFDYVSPEFGTVHPVVEVTHLSFSSKGGSKRPNTWSEFLDPIESGSGWWFTHAPGSGVWYDAGRTLVASCKNTLLLDLLEQLNSQGHGAPSRAWRLERAPHRCPREIFSSTRNVTHLLDALRATRERPCPSWLRCWKHMDHLLDDTWDACLAELGRSLGYETLFMTASPLDWEGHFIGELVDLRLPWLSASARGHKEADERSQPSLGAEAGRWAPKLAALWLDAYKKERRITLRDPLNPRDHRRTEGCVLASAPTLRLACTNHISWVARDEPDCENFCGRREQVLDGSRR